MQTVRDLTVREAAQIAQMSYGEIIILVRHRLIPSYKIGNSYQITRDDLNAFIKNKNLEHSTN